MKKGKVKSSILISYIPKIKKVIIGLALLVIISLGSLAADPGGSTMTRTVTPLCGPPNQVFTVTLTAVGSGGMEGIIKETKPSTFTFYDKDSWGGTFEFVTPSISGDSLHIAFVETGASGSYTYKLQGDLFSGKLSGVVDWDDDDPYDLGTVDLTICIDDDKDGYNVTGGCCGPVDCDDTNPNVHPGATETCNNVDDNCNTIIDENVVQACGSDNCAGTQTCSASVWGDCSTKNNDCDDVLYCNGNEKCDNAGTCQAGTAIYCSANNLQEIAKCDNIPDDGNLFTWDYRAVFTSVCDENADACTDGNSIDVANTCDKIQCGAECDTTHSCGDKCAGDMRNYNGQCTAGCTCSYSTEDCSLQNGWYDAGKTQWISTGTGQCTEKEQKEQEDRDYSCSSTPSVACAYTIIGTTQWVDTGNTRNKQDGTNCDDELFCTINDQCGSGICSGTAKDCGDGVSCTVDSCDENGNECVHTPDNSYCNDQLYCNGQEYCSVTLGCQSGTSVDCSDSLFCTVDERCDETLDSCASDPKGCSGNNLPAIATCDNAPDDAYHLTYDTRVVFTSVCDENADACTDGNSIDVTNTCDHDTCGAACDATHGCADTDCDVNDGCHGGKKYDCNDVPNTCQGSCTCTTNSCLDIYTTCAKIGSDLDGDGIDTECGDNCPAVANPGQEDCNNNGIGNACDAINPSATEICNNIDDDCDKSIDEELTRFCSENFLGECAIGTETCSAGVYSGCPTPIGEETIGSCDNKNNDCDNLTDESKNSCADTNCESKVCDSELLPYMIKWRDEHWSCDPNTLFPDCSCASNKNLLAAMLTWKNTHRTCVGGV